MTEERITPHELEARAAFYQGLAGLQSKLRPTSTLRDALALMPRHGFAWYYDNAATVLGHQDGHEVLQIDSADSLAQDLSFLLGLPSLVVDATDDEPVAPASAPPDQDSTKAWPEIPATEIAAPEPAPAPEPEPEPEPTPAPAAEPAPEPEPEPAAPVVAGRGDANTSTAPLSAEDAKTSRDMISRLSPAQVKEFKKAFCDTFAISPVPLRVSVLITEMRHASFVRRFVDEAEGMAAP